MRLYSRLGALAVLVAASQFALPAQAGSLDIFGSFGATNDPSGQDVVLLTAATGTLSGFVSAAGASASGAGEASGQASASSEYGRLGAQAGALAFGPFAEFGGGTSVGGINASWTDDFTIHASSPSLMFQAGTFTFTLQVSGSLLASAGLADLSNTRASYNVRAESASCGANCTTSRAGELVDFGSQGGGVFFEGDPIGNVTGTLNFIFDIPVNLKVELGAAAQAVADVQPHTSTARTNLGSTLLWGGFTEVRDNQGSLVTAYTVTSDSGVDWSQPVPETATALLVAIGFLALLLARWREQGWRGWTGSAR